MEAISARAGVGVASVYRYFPSRGAIYAEISRRLHRKFLSQLREVLAEPAPLDVVVHRVCRVAVEGPGVSRELRRCLNAMVPISWSQESAEEVYRAAIEEIHRHLAQHLDPPPKDLAERVFVAFSSSRGVIMLSMLFPDLAPSSEDLIRHMARGTLSVLVGDDVPPIGGGSG